MNQADQQGMSVAALIWSVFTLSFSMSGAAALVTLGAASTLTFTRRSEVVALLLVVFLALALLPMSAGWMGSLGRERAVRYGTLGEGLAEAAMILSYIGVVILLLGLLGGLAFAAGNSHLD